jgi:hypothetical protein
MLNLALSSSGNYIKKKLQQYYFSFTNLQFVLNINLRGIDINDHSILGDFFLISPFANESNVITITILSSPTLISSNISNPTSATVTHNGMNIEKICTTKKRSFRQYKPQYFKGLSSSFSRKK